MMSQDCFKPLKDFDMYEVNSEGSVRKITTKRMLTPRKTKSGDRFELEDSGHRITISRNKLAYCFSHDTSPYELRGQVISNGELMSISQHCENLRLLNKERTKQAICDSEKEDVIFNYERNIHFLQMLLKLLKMDIDSKEGAELESEVRKCIRKAITRYYRDKGEYRKEEIDDLAKDIFYDTFFKHCPFNMDCYIYEIVKRKLGSKRR